MPGFVIDTLLEVSVRCPMCHACFKTKEISPGKMSQTPERQRTQPRVSTTEEIRQRHTSRRSRQEKDLEFVAQEFVGLSLQHNMMDKVRKILSGFDVWPSLFCMVFFCKNCISNTIAYYDMHVCI